MITYWAVIDPDTFIVNNVCVAEGDDWQDEMERRNPGELIVQCNFTDNWKTEAGVGYTYDPPTTWFIPPKPVIEDDRIYFDREKWEWYVPEDLIDTPEP